MSSILTNTSALTALQNLRSTQASLSKTQNQISTGLKVSSAADNATNWSVSAQMKSDNGVLSVVQDGLKNSASMLKTATGALDKIKDAVDKIKQQLTAASQVTNGDYNTINATLKQLGEQIKDAVKGASFNGQNLLDGSLRADGASPIDIVAGFHQAASGATTTATIDKMSVQLQAVFVSGTVTTTGSTITDSTKVGALTTIAKNAIAGTPVTTITDTSSDTGSATVAYTAGQSSFTITKTVNGASVKTTYTGLDSSGNATAVDAATGPNRYATTVTVGAGTGTGLLVKGAGADKADLSNLSIDVTNKDNLAGIMANADKAFKDLTSYAATLGGVQARIESQQDFLGTLQDALTNGISALVDADMNETSTRLQALQTQQQLGVQSLSIANQNSQMILKLFQ